MAFPRIQEITVGTSRSSGLSIPNLTTVPGGKLLEHLLPAAMRSVSRIRSSSDDPLLVYVVGGLPDITERIKDREYDEIIFPTNKDPDQVSTSIINSIEFFSKEIIKCYNTFPVFATIGTQSLETWNTHRHRTRKTKYLLHQHNYNDMQAFLEHTIHIVNCHIKHINTRHGLITPNYARHITTDENLDDPSPRGLGRPRYSRLSDGCHLKSEKNAKWRSHLLDTMQDNREIVSQWSYYPTSYKLAYIAADGAPRQ